MSKLLDALPPAKSGAEKKLRAIPIRMQFDSADLIIRSRYEAFDLRAKRVVCASTDAGRATQIVQGKPAPVDCAGPDNCAFAQAGNVRCKYFGRINVQIEGLE
jgi:hypothetical protein